MNEPDPIKPRRRHRPLPIAIGVAVGLCVAVAAIYGIGAFQRNAAVDPVCRGAVETAKRIAPLTRGEVAAVAVAQTGRKLPQLAFHDAAQQPKTLADWRGRTVLLNLWATWCVPCRKEMPALDALQNKLGGPDFEVVAINVDTRDAAKPRTWLKEVGIANLGYYADPSGKAMVELKSAGKLVGLPTTLLIDGNGCEIATLAGPAEWASDDAVKLVEAALQR